MPDAAAVPGEADRGVSDSTAALYASTVSGGGCIPPPTPPQKAGGKNLFSAMAYVAIGARRAAQLRAQFAPDTATSPAARSTAPTSQI